MSAPVDRNPVNLARLALGLRRSELIDRLFELEEATAALAEARRRFDPESQEVRDASQRKSQAEEDLTQTRTAEAAAFATLQQALLDWMSDVPAEDFVSVQDDIARLKQPAPVLMFPLRIETRFVGDRLKLRVFPDEIFVNRHETALTRQEHAAAKKYYDDLNQQGNELARWREIIQRFGPERSAYILRTMRPSGFNTTPHPDFPWAERITGDEDVQLTYPTNIQFRAGAWTRPSEGILPDRWTVVTYRQGVRKIHRGRPIVEPLAISADPGLAPEQQTPISNNDYKIDEHIRWTVDFEQAKEVGMALEIGLSPEEQAIGTGGFDRVIVFGVKSSMDHQQTALHLIGLFDAHHHTRGMAFVRQGTPTNNVEGSPTPFPPEDEDGARSFTNQRERAPAGLNFFANSLPGTADASTFALTLGLPSGMFATADRALEAEVSRAVAMNVAMWPLTYGYFMKHVMDPIFSDDDIATAKTYFTVFVRPRGLSPAFRIGAVPYGVLPAISIYRWQQSEIEIEALGNVTQAIIGALRRLLAIWLDASAGAPRVTANASDPNVQLMRVLSTFPSTREVRVRHGVGGATWYDIFAFFGWDFNYVQRRLEELNEALFRKIGHPEWRPRIGFMVFDDAAWRLLFPLVVDKPNENQPLQPNFITGIRNASVEQLKNNVVDGAPPGFNFFYSLLRHSTLLEYARILDGLVAAGQKWREPELFGFPSQPPQATLIEQLIALATAIEAARGPHLQALALLENASTAELERLLSESLTTAAHRLDAWVSGVATQRTFAIRSATPAGQNLGAYAWVEDLRPVQRTFKQIPGEGTFESQLGTGGFIHTPSMTHAAAAAVLRNAHISMKGEHPSKYAIDLSSRRVRNARRVLDEVRAGQQLGAVLGYRFERALHEGHPGVGGLDAIRFALRNLFPLVAGKNGVDNTEPAESIAARNVVDGLALLLANREGTIDFDGDPNLPNRFTVEYNVVQAELAKLEELHDAVSDLLTAESVFQLARGNVAGAPASLDNLVTGGPPPDPLVAQSARTGIGLTHRVALVFPTDRSAELPPNWPAPTPRAQAEPTLDAWLGRVLGDPTKITCRVTFTEAPGNVSVSLADLDLRPLDVLALARVALEQGLGSVLDERVLAAALGGDTSKTNVQIDYAPEQNRNPVVDRTFPEALEAARALGAALGGARPLELGDLLAPAELEEGVEAAETTAIADVQELEDRAEAAREQLDEITNSTTAGAANSLELALQVADENNLTAAEIQNLRAALTKAALFAPERAFPPRTAVGPELLALARVIQSELARRIRVIPAELPPSPAPLAKARRDHAIAVLKAVFGSDFVALPALHAPEPDELARALAARSDLLGTDLLAPSRYLQQAVRCRASLRRFQKFSLYARALGAARPSLDVVQLPFVPGEKWLGLPFEANEPEQGRAAALLLSDESPLDPKNQLWRGLLLEQWTELIPNRKETTGVAFHYDSPRAAAPQAVLLAVPADADHPWQFEDLLASLNETLDLAKVRAVDNELLPFGQLLPLSLVAQNDSPDITLATVFSALAAPDELAFRGFS